MRYFGRERRLSNKTTTASSCVAHKHNSIFHAKNDYYKDLKSKTTAKKSRVKQSGSKSMSRMTLEVNNENEHPIEDYGPGC